MDFDVIVGFGTEVIDAITALETTVSVAGSAGQVDIAVIEWTTETMIKLYQ